MSGHVKYKRNSLACKMQEDSACNMWSAHGFVYIDDEMLMICILPVRVKEQPKSVT